MNRFKPPATGGRRENIVIPRTTATNRRDTACRAPTDCGIAPWRGAPIGHHQLNVMAPRIAITHERASPMQGHDMLCPGAMPTAWFNGLNPPIGASVAPCFCCTTRSLYLLLSPDVYSPYAWAPHRSLNTSILPCLC